MDFSGAFLNPEMEAPAGFQFNGFEFGSLVEFSIDIQIGIADDRRGGPAEDGRPRRGLAWNWGNFPAARPVGGEATYRIPWKPGKGEGRNAARKRARGLPAEGPGRVRSPS